MDMTDSLLWTISVWALVGLLAILAGVICARLFTPKPDEHFLRQGLCAECGSKSLRRTPIDEQGMTVSCDNCEAEWRVVWDASQPVERVHRQRARVPAIRFYIDSDLPAVVFEAELVRAAFPMTAVRDMTLHGATTPREMLQFLHDTGVQPCDLRVDHSLIQDTRFSRPWTAHDSLTLFYDHLCIGMNDPEKDEDYA